MEKIDKKIISRAKKDTELIKREARFVFTISKTNEVSIKENHGKKMNLISILGYPVDFETDSPVVLTEIGIGRARPYNATRGHAGDGTGKYIDTRKKVFSLSREQYLVVAPFIFDKIFALTVDTIKSWKHGYYSENPFCVPTKKHIYSRKAKTLYINESQMPVENGTRYSISVLDKEFLADICYAELYLNEHNKKKLKGIASLIDLRLGQYKNDFTGAKFLKLNGVDDIITVIRNAKLPEHLIHEMLALKKIRDYRINDILEFMGYKFDALHEISAERKIAHKAAPNVKERIGNMRITIVTNIKVNKGYIVFEVFPL